MAPSCVRMEKSLPSHALNNRENFSATKLEWDPGNTASHVAHSWSCAGMQDTWDFFGSALISWKVTGTSPYFLVPKFPDFYSRVMMLESFMRSAEMP